MCIGSVFIDEYEPEDGVCIMSKHVATYIMRTIVNGGKNYNHLIVINQSEG